MKLNSVMAVGALIGVSTAATNYSFAQEANTQESSIFSNMGLAAGGFVSVGPAYEGSDKYTVSGFPIAYPTFGDGHGERSRLTFRGVDDVRYAAFRTGGLDFGPVIGYTFGRDEDLSSDLTGLGDVDGGLIAGAFAEYTTNNISGDFGFAKQLTGLDDSGFLARFGAGYDADISESLTTNFYLGATYASDDYMDNYFGITNVQSVNSGLGAFDASGGIKNIDFKVSTSYQATDKLNLRANAGYSRLVGDAADSPISVTNNQLSGGLGFIFEF